MEAITTIKPFLCENMERALIRNEWEKWLRALKLYLDSEEITATLRKRNKLLHLGGTQLQEVAYNIPGAIVEYDAEEKNDVFNILVKKLNEYFSPTQNSTFERHLFRNTKPESDENFSKFLLRVRQQATKCQFGKTAKEANEINIKDKLIDSWAPVDLKRKLLEKEYSLVETIELCKIYEQIASQSAAMQVPQPQASVLGLNQIKTTSKGEECKRCGRRGHYANDPACRARNVKCHSCGFVGHFAQQCKTRPQKRKIPENTNTKAKQGRYEINQVNIETNNSPTADNQIPGPSNATEDPTDCFLMDECQQKPEDEVDGIINCQIGGVGVPLLIDSGSKANIIAGKDWETLREKKAVIWDVSTDVNNTLKPYASASLNIQYKFQTTINIPGKRDMITSFYVVPNGGISLLGMSTAIKLGVLKVGLDVQANEEVENINRSILKRLQIAYMNNRDPKEELSKYTLMYNTTPHGVTGKSPAEMLFGRPIRDKIQSLHELTSGITDEEARDRDWSKKLQEKNREDQARHAKADDLKPEDKVVVKNAIRTTKFTPMFEKQVFEILSRNGNEVTLIAGNRTIRRNISHIKPIPEPFSPNRKVPDHEQEEMGNEEQETEESEEESTNPEDLEETVSQPQRIKPLRLKKTDGMWNLD